jgi:type IV secretion system protein VirB6
MACPEIITGDHFLTRVLGNVDCQAQVLGSYGYQALAQPGSLAATFVAGLLTLFVALIGVRLLFGPPPGVRDFTFDALKVGVVLALAFSWPAFRTVVYDVAVGGPAEIVARITAPTGLDEGTGGLVARAQAADDAMLVLTQLGTGRTTNAVVDPRAPGATFASTALSDESGFAWSRLFWLAGILGVYGLLRLLAGLLLALAPLAAGLLLFEQTRGLFSGWLRGLVLTLLGTVGATVVLAVELAAIGPWLADALHVRQLGYATPAAPTELLAMTLGFAVIQVGMLGVLARVAFTRGWASLPAPAASVPAVADAVALAPAGLAAPALAPSRATRLADTVETQIRRESAANGGGRYDARAAIVPPGRAVAPLGTPENAVLPATGERLGSSYRRTSARSSRAGASRDRSGGGR